MQKINDLAGIGNAIVDFQFQVDYTDLEKFKIEKGEMRIVDSDFQNLILNYLSERQLNICSGGSAANTIVAFSSFGGKASYNTILGNDKYGQFYAKEFNQLNIELVAPFIENKSTGTCLVLITPDSERTMLTSLAVNEDFSEKYLSEELISKANWLYLEGYKFSSPKSSKALQTAVEMAKDNKTKISFTFSDTFITSNYKNEIEKVLEHTELIFCNESEALSFTGKDNPEDAIKDLSNIVPNVAVTLGKNGSVIITNKQKISIPPYPAERIDTTGAGDMYAGAFFYAMIYMNSLEKAGHLASIASAKIVSILGARLKENPKELLYSLNI